jgi:hypothetical protein
MASSAPKTNFGVASAMDRIATSHQVTRGDYLRLTSCLLSDHRLTDEERVKITRIFDHIRQGQLHLVD